MLFHNFNEDFVLYQINGPQREGKEPYGSVKEATKRIHLGDFAWLLFER